MTDMPADKYKFFSPEETASGMPIFREPNSIPPLVPSRNFKVTRPARGLIEELKSMDASPGPTKEPHALWIAVDRQGQLYICCPECENDFFLEVDSIKFFDLLQEILTHAFECREKSNEFDEV